MEKNVLLFFMSKYNALSKENVYEYNGSQVIANHTNMGPTRALISYLNNEEGEK